MAKKASSKLFSFFSFNRKPAVELEIGGPLDVVVNPHSEQADLFRKSIAEAAAHRRMAQQATLKVSKADKNGSNRYSIYRPPVPPIPDSFSSSTSESPVLPPLPPLPSVQARKPLTRDASVKKSAKNASSKRPNAPPGPRRKSMAERMRKSSVGRAAVAIAKMNIGGTTTNKVAAAMQTALGNTQKLKDSNKQFARLGVHLRSGSFETYRIKEVTLQSNEMKDRKNELTVPRIDEEAVSPTTTSLSSSSASSSSSSASDRSSASSDRSSASSNTSLAPSLPVSPPLSPLPTFEPVNSEEDKVEATEKVENEKKETPQPTTEKKPEILVNAEPIEEKETDADSETDKITTLKPALKSVEAVKNKHGRSRSEGQQRKALPGLPSSPSSKTKRSSSKPRAEASYTYTTKSMREIGRNPAKYVPESGSISDLKLRREAHNMILQLQLTQLQIPRTTNAPGTLRTGAPVGLRRSISSPLRSPYETYDIDSILDAYAPSPV